MECTKDIKQITLFDTMERDKQKHWGTRQKHIAGDDHEKGIRLRRRDGWMMVIKTYHSSWTCISSNWWVTIHSDPVIVEQLCRVVEM